jgi:hypothetical protein
LLLFGGGFLAFSRLCSWRQQRNAHHKETKKPEKTIHCCAATMVHQSAPNSNKWGQCTELKKVAQDQYLARLFNKVSEL